MSELIQNGEQSFFDANGDPLSGGKVFMYVPNTSNPQNSYVDNGLTVPNTNPIILDGAGRCVIWGAAEYRQVVQDQFGNTIWDKIVGAVPGVIDGNLSVNGSVTASGTVSGAALVSNGNLNVAGNTGLAGSLDVTGAATIHGGETVAGGLTVDGLHDTGSMTVDGNEGIGGTLTVTGTSTFNGVTNFNNNVVYNNPGSGTSTFHTEVLALAGLHVEGFVPGTLPISLTLAGSVYMNAPGKYIEIACNEPTISLADTVSGFAYSMSISAAGALVWGSGAESPTDILMSLDSSGNLQVLGTITPGALMLDVAGTVGPASLEDVIASLWGALRDLRAEFDAYVEAHP